MEGWSMEVGTWKAGTWEAGTWKAGTWKAGRWKAGKWGSVRVPRWFQECSNCSIGGLRWETGLAVLVIVLHLTDDGSALH